MTKRTNYWARSTLAEIAQKVSYDPDTGLFTRKVSAPGGYPAGSVAGSVDSAGYVVICVNNRRVRAHQLAWLFMTGEWSAQWIDHKNGIRSDNRIENLRLVTPSANRINQHVARSDSATGLQGVHLRNGRYRAVIKVDGHKRFFGTFSTAAEAHLVAMEAKRLHHPDFRG